MPTAPNLTAYADSGVANRDLLLHASPREQPAQALPPSPHASPRVSRQVLQLMWCDTKRQQMARGAGWAPEIDRKAYHPERLLQRHGTTLAEQEPVLPR